MTDIPEQFESERLILRRYEANDAKAIYRYASDFEVTKFMDWPTHTTIEDSVDFINATEDEWTNKTQLSWAITTKHDNALIGGLACSYPARKVSFGYVLSQSSWGNGYAPEAAAALVEWLLGIDDVTRVWATCDTENLASARVLQKLGLQNEGVLKCWSVRPNLPDSPSRDSYSYSLVKD